METTRERWSRLIAEFESSGLTRTEFAAAHGFHPANLSNWKWRLIREQRDGAEPKKTRAGRVTFVEVTRSSYGDATERIEIAIDARVIVRVPQQFDEHTLRRVLAVLEVGK